MTEVRASLRQIPAVTRLLQEEQIQQAMARYGRKLVTEGVREVLTHIRQQIQQGEQAPTDLPAIVQQVIDTLHRWTTPSLTRAVNATGVVLHTGLGRAVLAPAAQQAILEVAHGHALLEIDRESGERGDRVEHVRDLLCRLTGAEDATVVNNNAGAVLLAVTALAQGKEVVISRGQLVEIGGAFRMPDIIAQSGAKLVEVGTTNRTRLNDYEQAIGANTALILRCHPSNFRIVGFTEEVEVAQLTALAHRHGLPLLDDVGSGCLVDTTQFGLAHEPTLQESLKAGADVVTCSGDKLLGGPQAGIILGRKDLLQRIRRHPLHRALRVDKLTLAALEATLRLYLNPEQAVEQIPTLRALALSAEQIRRRAVRIQRRLRQVLPTSDVTIRLKPGFSEVGGGSLPGQLLPTTLVAVRSNYLGASALARALRLYQPPVFARIEQDEVVIDPRTLLDEEILLVVQAVARALEQRGGVSCA